jgi:hypothetical protein
MRINIDPNFDPDNWCAGDYSVRDKPIKKLICIVVDLLELITPLVSFINLLFNATKDLIIDNKEFTELLLILTPSIPLVVLTYYFLTELN